MSGPIQAVVLGATGYVGGELLRLLSGHPEFELAGAVSASRQGGPIAATFANLAGAFGSRVFHGHGDWLDTIEAGGRLALFSAAPHGSSAAAIARALDAAATKNVTTHVVDTSADFRYGTESDYAAVYGIAHGASELLPDFRCAVPEHDNDISVPHIGHPGCFTTAVLLATVPLMRSCLVEDEIFAVATTGSTGSGRKPQPGTHHPERHSNLYAYKPLEHRHAPEIARLTEAASGHAVRVHFVPQSGPFARGIYATMQAKTTADVPIEQLRQVFTDAYEDAPFVEVVSGMPRLKDVVASNRCHLGVATSGDSVVVTTAIDNLVKGAAGGAVQWMNRLWHLPETTGLIAAAPGWT